MGLSAPCARQQVLSLAASPFGLVQDEAGLAQGRPCRMFLSSRSLECDITQGRLAGKGVEVAPQGRNTVRRGGTRRMQGVESILLRRDKRLARLEGRFRRQPGRRRGCAFGRYARGDRLARPSLPLFPDEEEASEKARV